MYTVFLSFFIRISRPKLLKLLKLLNYLNTRRQIHSKQPECDTLYYLRNINKNIFQPKIRRQKKWEYFTSAGKSIFLLKKQCKARLLIIVLPQYNIIFLICKRHLTVLLNQLTGRDQTQVTIKNPSPHEGGTPYNMGNICLLGHAVMWS